MLGFAGYFGAWAIRSIITGGSSASNPMIITMSDEKLMRLCPTLFFSTGLNGTLRCFFWDGLALRYWIRDMLLHGDSRAAVVMSTTPLLVACYCDDSDAVCLLQFPDSFREEYGLRVGSRLVTVLNSYVEGTQERPGVVAEDLVQGDLCHPYYVNFWPLIADFMTKYTHTVEARKRQISDSEFEHCRTLGKEHLRRFGGVARDGRPDRSMRPAALGPR